jgi:hypothetical protein
MDVVLFLSYRAGDVQQRRRMGAQVDGVEESLEVYKGHSIDKTFAGLADQIR